MSLFPRNSPKPFSIGDTVRMEDDGFHIGKGEIRKVRTIKYTGASSGWCLGFDSSNTTCYRASRFTLVKRGKHGMLDQKGTNMKSTFVIFQLSTNPSQPIGNPIIMSGEASEVQSTVTALLKDNPTATYAYGRLNVLARLPSQPVEFICI